MSVIEKIRRSNQLLSIVENEAIKQAMEALPGGEAAYLLFQAAVEAEMARLIGQGEEQTQQIVEIASIVASAREMAVETNKAYESLANLLGAYSQTMQRKVAVQQQVQQTQAVAAQAQQTGPRRRGMQHVPSNVHVSRENDDYPEVDPAML